LSSGIFVVYNDILIRFKNDKKLLNRDFNILSAFLSVVVSAYCALCLSVSAHPRYETYFSILFGIEAVLLVPPVVVDVIFLKKVADNKTIYFVNRKLALKIRRYLIASIVIALFSTFAWVIPEYICPMIDGAPKYLFWSHGVWHIGMSYALITIAQCFIFIHLVGINPGKRKNIDRSVIRQNFTWQEQKEDSSNSNKKEESSLDPTDDKNLFAIFFFTIFLIVQPHNHTKMKEDVFICSECKVPKKKKSRSHHKHHKKSKKHREKVIHVEDSSDENDRMEEYSSLSE